MHGAARPIDAPGAGLPAGDAAANRATYEAIVAPFDQSRHAPWPAVVGFLAAQAPTLVLDLAAGNARHAVAAAHLGHRVVAVDVARSLLARGVGRARLDRLAVGGVAGDALHLPLAAASFPVVLFIAGLHCMRGRATRLAALAELRRVAMPGAHVLLTVWERDEARFRGALARGAETRALPNQPDQTAQPAPEPGDIDLPWAHGLAASVPRFFHLYEHAELVADLEEAGFSEAAVQRERLGRQGTWNLIATARA